MTWTDRLSLFSALDYGALAFLVIAWLAIGWRIENPGPNRPSVSVLMAGMRRSWMHHMVTREPRVFDAQLVGNLRQGTAFFASATMIAIGGGLALVGNAEQLVGLANDLTLDNAPAIVWEIRLVVVLLFLSNSFLKFVWAHRLFGYCSILMGAVPNDPDAPTSYARAKQAAEINITAARSYNRAMRAIYFALAAAAWLLGASVLILASIITVAVLWRREFASQSREVLLSVPPDTES